MVLSHLHGPTYAAETMISHLAIIFDGEQQQQEWPTVLTYGLADSTVFDVGYIEELIKQLAPPKAPGANHITEARCHTFGMLAIKFISALLVLGMGACGLADGTHYYNIPERGPHCSRQLPSPSVLQSIFCKLLEWCLLPKTTAAIPVLDIAQGGF
ncbi:hypothetical protein EC973_003895, partial [Apophysomyces ossiformis]